MRPAAGHPRCSPSGTRRSSRPPSARSPGPARASRRSCPARRPCPVGPTRLADSRTSIPPPEPRSRTVSPSRSRRPRSGCRIPDSRGPPHREGLSRPSRRRGGAEPSSGASSRRPLPVVRRPSRLRPPRRGRVLSRTCFPELAHRLTSFGGAHHVAKFDRLRPEREVGPVPALRAPDPASSSLRRWKLTVGCEMPEHPFRSQTQTGLAGHREQVHDPDAMWIREGLEQSRGDLGVRVRHAFARDRDATRRGRRVGASPTPGRGSSLSSRVRPTP